MGKVLEVKNLRVSFRTNGGTVKAVRDISFDMYEGETLAIVGESGSGKSVTAKSILGINAANTIIEGGEIIYNGEDLLKYSEAEFNKVRGNEISMIFQDPLSSLDPIMTIGKQMTEATLLNNKARKKAAKKELKFYHTNLAKYMRMA
ncbi:MAG: ABC transporter ATP-binding protein, partial [Lachnospiraceae bacterium]|nr:ABC transporter ATP-binding protein [Lachnospiraceae bacterium]